MMVRYLAKQCNQRIHKSLRTTGSFADCVPWPLGTNLGLCFFQWSGQHPQHRQPAPTHSPSPWMRCLGSKPGQAQIPIPEQLCCCPRRAANKGPSSLSLHRDSPAGRLSPLLLSRADKEDRPLCLLWLGEWGLLGAAPAPLGTNCLFAEIPSHSCSQGHPRMDGAGVGVEMGEEEEL